MKSIILLTNLLCFHVKAANFLELQVKGSLVPRTLRIVERAGLHVSEDCLTQKATCDSFVQRMVKRPISSEKEFIGHPASDFCNSNGGTSVTLIDSKNNEYSYCWIKNNLYIDSWDLYDQRMNQP